MYPSLASLERKKIEEIGWGVLYDGFYDYEYEQGLYQPIGSESGSVEFYFGEKNPATVAQLQIRAPLSNEESRVLADLFGGVPFHMGATSTAEELLEYYPGGDLLGDDTIELKYEAHLLYIWCRSGRVDEIELSHLPRVEDNRTTCEF